MKKKIRDLTKEEMENQGFMLMLHQMGKGDENGITPCKVIHFDKSVNDFLNTEIDIPDKHILDKEEHDYLRAVCKPYDVYKIAKIDCISCYKITIFYNTPNDTYLTFSLPIFDEESPMYKGMEPDEHYTIEELELDKEWKE